MNSAGFEIYDCIIPDWALCYIVNGDASSLTDEDIEKVDRFMERQQVASLSVNDEGPYFSWKNDIDDLGSDVYDCTFTKIS